MQGGLLRHLGRLTVIAAVLGLVFLSAGCPTGGPNGNNNGNDNEPPRPLDDDDDGIPDDEDDCPDTPADVQVDEHGCPLPPPGDRDGDGVSDTTDNCPDDPNADQADADSDGVGDACDGGDDTDRDTVPDSVDNCPTTRNTEQEDGDTDGIGNACDNCPSEANAGQADDDSDGIGEACDPCPGDPLNDADQDGVCGADDECPNTAPDTDVGADGCDADDPPPASCGNNRVEAGEQCDTGGASATCDSDCTNVACGDGRLNTAAGEVCDDGNTTAGDGCSATCTSEGRVPNDSCSTPTVVTDTLADGRAFTTAGATTDGPAIAGACAVSGDTQIGSDVWYSYTASCSGSLVVSLCGSEFDTKLAVYSGNACPTGAPAACSDDDCGAGALESRVQINVTEGEAYLVRVGGFQGETGQGTLTILCDVPVCGEAGSGSCDSAHAGRGCDDIACCSTTCSVDPYCCDVEWDNVCASESPGLCSGSFAVCGGSNTNNCQTANTGGGCSEATCCNLVCGRDPFCCITEWDSICADEAADLCP